MLLTSDRRVAKSSPLPRPLLVAAGIFFLMLNAHATDLAAEAFDRGKGAFERRDFAQALNAFEQAHQQSPSDERYTLWAGRAAGRMAESAGPLGAFSLARKTRRYFEQSYGLNPRNPEVLADLAEFYEKAPRFMGGDAGRALRLRAELKALESTGAAPVGASANVGSE